MFEPIILFVIFSKSKCLTTDKRPIRFVSRCPEELLHMARESRAMSEVRKRVAKTALFLSPVF